VPAARAPRRLRLSRRKGARLPKGAVVVARPTKWGNPHRIDTLSRASAIVAYRRDLIAGRLRVTVADVQRELKGRDLACWCRLDQACHAEVLLEVANAKARRPRRRASQSA
jgi:hypothetical protein